MRGRIVRFTAAFQALLLMGTLVVPALVAATGITTDLWVYQDGDTVTVTGIDYGPNEVVDFVTTDPNGVVIDTGSASSDSLGGLTYAFLLHATVSGIYDVVATGETSGLTATTEFDPVPGTPPNLFFVDARATTGSITLTWDKTTNQSPDCYRIYRAASAMVAIVGTSVPNNPACAGSGGNYLATVAQPSGSGPISYVDSSPLAGANFYYVTSIRNSNGGESSSSNQVTTRDLEGSLPGNFGSVQVGSSSAPSTVTVTNNSGVAIKVQTPTLTGANAGDFAISGLAPATGASVANGATFSFQVTFTPGGVGARSANLNVNDSNGALSVFNTRVAPLAGTGTDTTAPSGSIAINSGAAQTNTTAVNLHLLATDAVGVTAYRVANGASCAAASYVAVSSTTSLDINPAFTLSAGDGTKTVCAQFRDASGNESSTVTDTIVLDSAAPSGTIDINNGAAVAGTAAVTLHLVATDSVGVTAYRVANGASCAAASYVAVGSTTSLDITPGFTLSAGDGTKTVCVQFKDAAGNESSTATDTIVLDTTAPSGSIAINSGAAQTNTTAVNLHLLATDAVGVTAYRVANGASCAAASYVAVSSTTSLDINPAFTLSAGDGTKTVCAQFRDASGNESSTVTDTIVLDSAAPSAPSVTSTMPGSPSNVTSLNVRGTAEPNSTVKVYSTSSCIGPVLGTDVANGGSGNFSAAVTVGLNSTTTFYATATDAAGNVSTCSTTFVTYVEDSIPPSVTINQGGSQADPTSTSPIIFSVHFSETVTGFVTGDVTLSGTAGATTAAVSGSGQDYTVSVSGMAGFGTVIAAITANKAVDLAGNGNTASSSTDNQVTYAATDSTPPVITYVVTPSSPDGLNGWYKSNVQLVWTVTEPETPGSVATVGCTNQSITADQAATTYTCSASSTGGSAGPVSVTIRRDATAPTGVATNLNRVADHNGWYNHAVGWTTTGSDPTSGIASCSTGTYSGPDTVSTTVSGSCTDNAGNTSGSAASAAFMYDATAPINVSGAPDRAADHNGWYNHPVDVVFSGTDATSGIDACTTVTGYDTDGNPVSVLGSCTDLAGNTSADVSSSSFKYDNTDPYNVATNLARSADHNGWYNHAVGWATTGLDATSGIDTCSTGTYSGPDTASTTVSGSCTDLAGNASASAASAAFKYDATAPDVTVSPDRGPDSGSWYTDPVTFDTAASDAMSGVVDLDCTTDQIYSGPAGSGLTVGGSCTDQAGNVGSGTSDAFDYDASDPTATITTPSDAADSGTGWFNIASSGADGVLVHVATSDNLAVTSLACTDNGIDVGPLSPAGDSFAIFDGSHDIECSVADAAANSGSASDSFDVDQTAPINVSGAPDRAADHNGWYNHPVDVVFSGTDATSGIDACTTVTGYDTDGNPVSVLGSCTDLAGNTSADVSSSSFKYDNTDPYNVATNLARSADHNGWYNHAVGWATTGLDATSGIDTCSTGTYSGPDTASTTVSGSCTDLAGNASASAASAAFKYDATAPTSVSGAPDRIPDHNGWYNHPVDVAFTGTDATSLIASCTTVAGYNTDGAAVSVLGHCTDNAGNSSADVSSSTFAYDATAPTGVATNLNRVADHNGWYNHAVGWTTTGSDPTSGIASCSTGTYSGPDTVSTTVSGSCTDNAGNTSGSAASAAFMYDATAPTATLSVAAGTLGANGWYTSNVTVHTAGTDSISNPTTCTLDQYQTTETTGTAFAGSCMNDAGLSADAAPITIKLDKSAPVITNTGPTTAANGNGWYNHDVTNGYTVNADISGPDAACAAAFPGNAQNKTTIGEGSALTVTSNSCTDLAGNTAAGVNSAAFKVDKTAPVITNAGPTTSPNLNGWYKANVTNTFTLNAEISGPNAACAAAFPANSQTKTTSTEGTAVTVTSDGCTDLAGNTALGVTSATFKIDLTNPTAAITSPSTGLITVATWVAVSGTAGDTPSGIGAVVVNGVSSSFISGAFSAATVPLGNCGANTITALATDMAGRTSATSITVTRVCTGSLTYYQPLDQSTGATPVINTGKAGRVIPVKVTGTLSLGGTPTVITDTSLAANGLTLRIGVNGTSCTNTATTDDIEAYADAGAANDNTNIFRYSSGQWIYNLDTGKAPSVVMTIGKCYRLDVYLQDAGGNKILVSTGPGAGLNPYAIFQPTK
jgi:Glucodextranase, domain B